MPSSYPSLLLYALDRAGPSRGPPMGTFTAVGDLGSGMGARIMGIILPLTSYKVMFLCRTLTGAAHFFYFYLLLREKGGDRNANL